MDTLLLLVVPFVGFIVAYRTYGRFLARKIFKLDDAAPVPSKVMNDGIDYVPTRKGIIFGHHFTSIAGTGPIVGPAIGIIWGWVPAIIWVVVGSIFMGAVHDLGALVVSLRNQGKSLSEVAAKYISPRVRTIFFGIVFLELWIVIAVFGMVIASLFALYPRAVFPIWMEVPIAVGLGVIVYKRGGNVALFTVLAVATMYLTVVAGHVMPDAWAAALKTIPGWVWIVVLFVYAYVASTLPVTMLLQPRDYINAWQLFIVMALLVVGAVASSTTGRLHIVAPAFDPHPKGAPPIWPFLCVTIACGAISGFHSLVSGGTTSKQISKEGDALPVGYGSMLMEGALAVLVIVAVAAGIGMLPTGATGNGADLWQAHYESWGVAAGLKAKLDAVVIGSANMTATIGVPKGLGLVILGVFIASFAGTTLDTATRIQRYAIGELATSFRVPALPNRYVATAVAVISAGVLAFSASPNGIGTGALTLWPLFGAVNQLLAALALLAITLYLKRKGGLKYLVTAIPFLFMVVMTLWAVIHNQIDFTRGGKWLLASINATALLLALWMIVEAARAFVRPAVGQPAPVPDQPA